MTAEKYPDTVPDDDPAFNHKVSHQARVYNYLLGGKDYYEVDRVMAEQMTAVYPDSAYWARANRAFLGRAVRFLAGEAGVAQFLDIGAGLPAPGNTHEVAQETQPDSRVVYVDFDPVVLAHARAFMVAREPGSTDYIDADLRNPGPILERAANTLDFTRPVGLLLITILHAIGDQDDPWGTVARVMDALPSGSYLAATHWCKLPSGQDDEETLTSASSTMSRQQYVPRSEAEIMRFFDGLELVEPGLVPLQDWKPDPGDQAPGSSTLLWKGAVGRKP